jgi:hypothetical protein
LATTARPPEVAPWIKRQINKKHEPVSITTNYVSRFVAWWKAIQPAWRIDKDGLLSRNAPAKEAWTFLNKGGSAGLYVVVMALSWWISDLKTDSDRLQAWAIVDDITWVFSMLMPTVGPAIASSKRSSPDTPDNDLDKDSNPAPK